MLHLTNKQSNHMPPLFAIIAGPGGEAFNTTHINQTKDILETAGLETLLIGNGEDPLLEDNITATLSSFRDYQDMTICFIAHGYKTQKGNHILWLGEKADTDTTHLLRRIIKTRGGKSTDFILSASYSGTILPKVCNKLPRKSYITLLAPDEKLVTGDNLVKLMQRVYTNPALDISAYSHPAKDICLYGRDFSDLSPQLAMAKKGIIDLKPSNLSLAKQGFFEKFLNRAAI